MNRFLTNEQAAYLSQLYTETDAPKLHHAPAAHVRRLEREYAERGMTIQQLCRTIHDRNKRIAELEKQKDYLLHRLDKRIDELEKALMLARRRGETIHRLERKLSHANRKHAALHRAMRENAKWPRFSDGAPVKLGDTVKGVMCDVEVASIVFRADCIVLYDSQMFHYVKLDGDESAQRPDGTRLALD